MLRIVYKVPSLPLAVPEFRLLNYSSKYSLQNLHSEGVFQNSVTSARAVRPRSGLRQAAASFAERVAQRQTSALDKRLQNGIELARRATDRAE